MCLEDRERGEPEGERKLQVDAVQAEAATLTRKRKKRKRQRIKRGEGAAETRGQEGLSCSSHASSSRPPGKKEITKRDDVDSV